MLNLIFVSALFISRKRWSVFFFFRGTRKELALEFKVIYFKNYIFFRNKKKKGFSQWDEGQRKRERLLDYASFMFSFQ